MSDSNLPASTNVQDLSSTELEQINGGLISAIQTANTINLSSFAKLPSFGACPACRSGLDKLVIQDPRVLPMLTPQLAASRLGF